MNIVNPSRIDEKTLYYELDDGHSFSLDVEPALAEFIIKAWEKRDTCGHTIAHTPAGKPVIIYVIPTTDGISFMFRPWTLMKVKRTVKRDSDETMLTITLED